MVSYKALNTKPYSPIVSESALLENFMLAKLAPRVLRPLGLKEGLTIANARPRGCNMCREKDYE